MRKSQKPVAASIPVLTLALYLSAVSLGVACNGTAKRPIAARPNVPVPKPLDTTQPLSFPSLAGRGSRPALSSLIEPPAPLTAADFLVVQVQASLDLGERHYQAGNPNQAREDFSHGLDLILNSGIEVQQDHRLRDLFDQIVDKMHSYDLDGSQPDDQNETVESVEEQQEGEPAPIEEIADLSLPPGDPRLASTAEQELISVPHDLPLTVNDSVLSYLSFFLTPRGRAIVETGLRRSGRYRDMIRGVLKQEGLPQDLIYLAQAESAFQPLARSRMGARGIWQFMPYRGREYHLARTPWVDERADPEKSTHAAAQHLRDLYQLFGDWYLVMAAYNSGPLNVSRGIERTGFADYWELQRRDELPRETRNYVPIILALTLIAKDPARYGIHEAPEAPDQVDIVKPGHALDLRLAADVSGADVETLRRLNPELVRLATPGDPDFTLRLPAGTGQNFASAIAAIPVDKWLTWRRHRVAEGETLYSLARRYHVSAKALAEANQLAASGPLAVGAKITIPANAPLRAAVVHYRVRRGDTWEAIADQFGVNVEDLLRWNRTHRRRPQPGARLRIIAGDAFETSGSLTSRSARRAPNRQSGWPSKAGSQATLRTEGGPVSGNSAARSDAASQKLSGTGNAGMAGISEGFHVSESNRGHYRVKRGETLYSIARSYHTTVESLRASNPFLSDRQLESGDVLNIPR